MDQVLLKTVNTFFLILNWHITQMSANLIGNKIRSAEASVPQPEWEGVFQ